MSEESQPEKEFDRNGPPLIPIAPDISTLPTQWNLTTVAPPKNYNRVKPGLGFDDFYNLRQDSVPEEQETAAMRNLRAWRDANYQMPLDTALMPPKRRLFNFAKPIHEFCLGFLFGSIFAAIWRGPHFFRTWRKLRRRETIYKGPLPWHTKLRMFRSYIHGPMRIPLLFAFFQLALRGFGPIVDGYWVPAAAGILYIGWRHASRRWRRKIRRPFLYEHYWSRWRSIGNIHELEHRSILQGSFRKLWTQRIMSRLLRLRRVRHKLWRGMFIILILEIFILAFHGGEHLRGSAINKLGFKSFGILASPTFGPDPEEISKRRLNKRPEVPAPVVDGNSWWTAWLWNNNNPRSGAPYVADNRMFSVPDLRPILEDSPDQQLKYDDTALKALDMTPAFYLGQKVRISAIAVSDFDFHSTFHIDSLGWWRGRPSDFNFTI